MINEMYSFLLGHTFKFPTYKIKYIKNLYIITCYVVTIYASGYSSISCSLETLIMVPKCICHLTLLRHGMLWRK